MFDFDYYTRAMERRWGVSIDSQKLKKEFLDFLLLNPLDKSMSVPSRFEERDGAADIAFILSAANKALKQDDGFDFIRMGDGEGRFVGDTKKTFPSIYEFSLALSKNIWFGYSEQMPGVEFFDALGECYQSASVVGYSPALRIDLEFRNIWYGYFGCVNGNNFLVDNFKGGSDRLVRN